MSKNQEKAVKKAAESKAVQRKDAGILKLTVTLFAICTVCALLLGLTNMITEPIIEDNAEKKKAAAIAAEVLPGFDGTLTQVNYIGDDTTIRSVQKGSDGSFVVEVSPKTSYSGNLKLLIGIDANKAVAGISVSSSGETSGVGSRALESDYLIAQYLGKSGSVALVKNGGEIEGVGGASFTSAGVCEAVNSALQAIENTNDAPFDPSLVPDEPDPTDNVDVLSVEPDGNGYVVTVDCSMLSFSKNLKIQVNIGADKAVSSVTVTETGESPNFGALASEPEFIDQFVGANSTVNLTTNGGEINSIAGASTTSNAVCVGVNAALKAVEQQG